MAGQVGVSRPSRIPFRTSATCLSGGLHPISAHACTLHHRHHDPNGSHNEPPRLLGTCFLLRRDPWRLTGGAARNGSRRRCRFLVVIKLIILRPCWSWVRAPGVRGFRSDVGLRRDVMAALPPALNIS